MDWSLAAQISAPLITGSATIYAAHITSGSSPGGRMRIIHEIFFKNSIRIGTVAIGVALTTFLLVRIAYPQRPTLKAPFNVESYFVPSGWMGDGEVPGNIDLNTQWEDNCHSGPTCIRVDYKFDRGENKKGWAGIYWQFPDKNWGEKPGRRIESATKITFWARGEKGGELVEFKAGGIYNQGAEYKYQDSFETALGVVKLKNTWKQFKIDLAGENLSSIIGAFAWVAKSRPDAENLVFFLDGITYE